MTQGIQWESEDVGRYYDERGANWFAAMMGDNSHVGYWSGPADTSDLREATDHLTDLLFERLRVGPGDRVLDLGCGVGRPAVRLAEATGAAVLGVAISQEQVKRATVLAEKSGLAGAVSFQRADAMSLPLPDASFDAVMALESVMHMPSRSAVFAEVARVLKPGGRLVLTDMFDREVVTADRRAAVDAYLNSTFSTNADLGEYPVLLRGAGLRPLELLDLTENSWARTHSAIAEVLSSRKNQLDDAYGSEFVSSSDSVLTALSELTEIGYLLAVAERPAA